MSDQLRQPMGTGTLNDPEPAPVKNDHPEMWPLVIRDLMEFEKEGSMFGGIVLRALIADAKERHAQGVAKYGVALQPFNGRDALKDAYQESLDMLVYTSQFLLESNVKDDSGEQAKQANELMTIAHNSAMAYRAVIYARDGK